MGLGLAVGRFWHLTVVGMYLYQGAPCAKIYYGECTVRVAVRLSSGSVGPGQDRQYEQDTEYEYLEGVAWQLGLVEVLARAEAISATPGRLLGVRWRTCSGGAPLEALLVLLRFGHEVQLQLRALSGQWRRGICSDAPQVTDGAFPTSL